MLNDALGGMGPAGALASGALNTFGALNDPSDSGFLYYHSVGLIISSWGQTANNTHRG